jgi:phosphoglycolate phosphatase|tara:strand:+ start:4904 stop:5560 length:657 start_codon:yes stop_codon:yes gene_type:complete
MNKIKSILFDLDGTFIDSSMDICVALNRVLLEHKFNVVDCSELKYHISKGAVGIIEYASKVNGKSIDSSLLRSEFLQEYSKNCFVHTKMIDDMSELIKFIENKNMKWGIVTNKHSKYANKIIEGLSLTNKIHCLITGDMVDNPKPSPEGLLKALIELKINPNEILYLGDDERDVLAAKDAGMMTGVANFGFIEDFEDIKLWDPDIVIYNPKDLIQYLS